MLASKKGIEINREQLWALLSFCGEGEHHACVHFRINGSGKLEAAATSGKRSVEAIAKAEGGATGEWAIDSAFLEKCRLSMVGDGETLLIRLTPKGLTDAWIVEAKTGKMIAPIGWNREAATTQVTMTDIVSGLRVPDDKNHTGSWCAFDPEHLRGLTRVRVATEGCPITFYPPTEPTAPMHFEAVGKDGTRWRGAILPEKVLGPGQEADEPPEADEGAPGRSDRQVKLDLKARAAKPREDDAGGDDGIIEDEDAERMKAEQAASAPTLSTQKKKPQRKAAKAKPN